MGDLKDVKLNLIESVEDAYDFMRWLGERHEIVAVDTETTGLNPQMDKIRLIQFGDADTGWAMRWDRWAGVALQALTSYTGDFTFHNTKFDVCFIEHSSGQKIPWRQVHNTMAMAQIVNPSGSAALKTCCTQLVDAKAAGASRILDEGMATHKWDWATVPYDFDPYWTYAALDTVLTARLHGVLKPKIDADPGLLATYELEMAVERILADMEVRGAAVDIPYATAKRQQMTEYIDATRQWVLDNHGISPTADAQVAQRFIELGVQLTKRTKSGSRFSVDKDVMKEIIIDYPNTYVAQLADSCLRVRQYTKLRSTYLDHFIWESIDGRVHCSIRPMGARTGRMSVTNPALQTLPRADDGNPAAIAIRNCFIPSEGNKLVTADFDQIELRLMAHFSQDATMLEVLSGTGDPFTEFARRIFNDPTLEKKDKRRQMTKNASYAKAYGAGAEKFSLTAGVPLTQGKAFLDLFDRQFPGVKVFQNQVQRVAEQRLRSEGVGYVRTPLGRKLTGDDHKLYALVNYLLQGTAADVMKSKMVALDMAGFGEFMILPVHDEVFMDVPADLAEEVGREAAHVMSETEQFSVALPVGVDGPFNRWGEKYA